MTKYISPSKGSEVTPKDWNDAKARRLREVVEPDKPVMFCVAFEFDPKLNPTKNVVDLLREAVALIARTFGFVGNPTFTRHENVHEVRYKERICRSSSELTLMMSHLLTKITDEGSPSLRVMRQVAGAVCEAWFIRFEEPIKSVSLPESEADLVHPKSFEGELYEAPVQWKRKSSWLLEKTLQFESGPRKPITANSPLVTKFLDSVFPNQNVKALSATPLYPKVANKLMPRLVRIVLDTTACCCQSNTNHALKCTFLDLTETGDATAYCSFCDKSKIVSLERSDVSVFNLLNECWSATRWIRALNKTYTQLANGRIVERMIDDEGELTFVDRHSISAYLEGHTYPVWAKLKKKGRPRKDGAEEPPPEWILKDVVVLWLTSLDRAQCKEKIFNPKLAPGIGGDFLNMYEGLGVQPKAPASGKLEDAAPLLRRHMREVICNNDPIALEYLEHCLAQLVRFPYIKLCVVFVLKAKQGAGKNTLLDVMKRIFGRHGIEVTNSRHVTGNFNQHLAHKICIILNEAVWGGDKQSEGTLKASITEATTMFEPKGVDAKEGRNYWTFFISSNEKWCVPASPEARRFVMLPVSDSRIGDAAYFTALHNAIQNGEEGEFLWYLQRRACSHPDQWKPAHNMPPRTAMIVDQMMQDRSQSLLRFLVGQLKEDGEWIWPAYRESIPIIQKGVPTKVHRAKVLEALRQAAERDVPLRNQLGQQNMLTAFFKETLGECFSNDKRLSQAEIPMGSTNDKCYWFAPAEEIMDHLAKTVLSVANYFGDVPISPNKRR